MAQLVANGTAIANHFECLVGLVHHSPLADEDRLRGWTGLLGGLNVSILSKSTKGSLVATLDVKKMKDEDELCPSLSPSSELSSAATVLKVSVTAIRDDLKRRGFLDVDDKGVVTATSRSHVRRAKTDLLKAPAKLVEKDGQIWRP